MLLTTVVGNYPKISKDKNALNLRNALNQFDQKKISKEELERTYQETILRVIKEQEEAGIDIITDGQIRWFDLVTPLAKNIEGMEIGGLIRFFDNNFYFRRPVVKSEVKFKNYSTVEEFKFASLKATKKVKAVIVGPFTLAKLSLDEHYHDLEKLTLDLAEILNQEIIGLENAGAEIIQIDEPSLCFSPESFDLAKKALDIVMSNIKAKTACYFYFGSIKNLYPRIFDLPVDIIGLDIKSMPENLDLFLQNDFSQEIALGCVDARNTKMESEEELLKLFEKVTKRFPHKQIYVNPSCGLEFLPQENAFAKLKNMANAVKKFNQQK
jgi:5-methyltetrahydropteroyltriglutamate--homocysteine methyltransferase